ncbi:MULTISPECIES: ECF transporter S component [Rhizobium]|uniref:ECF transporter S component n=1 Tax=Rhizobium TaxID=379 RepID=UPI00195CC813|nr:MULTISPECIES: ECF transporter S component [Rhizobium]MBM7044735.1 ECF transporter S component [Rhizobium lusitanum]
MSVGLIYLIVAIIAVALAAIAFFINRGKGGQVFVAFTLLEIVIMAIIGVINGVLGTPNAMIGRFFMTFSGAYGFLAFAAICGGFYIAGPLCGYIIRKPGAATIAETMNGVAQVLSGNPNGIMVLGAGFLQGFMSDVGFAFYGYRKWTLSVLALSGALAPLLQQIPEVYFFGVGDMGISYNLLALIIRMVSGAVYAIILVKPIAHGLAKAGVLRGTAIAKSEASATIVNQPTGA